jgi:hypothetical protein
MFCPAVKKSNDLATFAAARLGKPSHLLEGDKLKQFLAQVCVCVWGQESGAC